MFIKFVKCQVQDCSWSGDGQYPSRLEGRMSQGRVYTEVQSWGKHLEQEVYWEARTRSWGLECQHWSPGLYWTRDLSLVLWNLAVTVIEARIQTRLRASLTILVPVAITISRLPAGMRLELGLSGLITQAGMDPSRKDPAESKLEIRLQSKSCGLGIQWWVGRWAGGGTRGKSITPLPPAAAASQWWCLLFIRRHSVLLSES